MKRLFKFRYPKLITLCILIIISYILFSKFDTERFLSNLGELSYLSYFLAGMLFSFGFTTPFAIGFFVTANPSNIILISLIGGLGALTSDILIFKFIRLSFMDEFERLENTHPAKVISREIKKDFSKKVINYILFILAGVVIASPLPDELGVTMLAGIAHIKYKSFMIISFIMNSLGILIFLLI